MRRKAELADIVGGLATESPTGIHAADFATLPELSTSLTATYCTGSNYFKFVTSCTELVSSEVGQQG
jgi:hypothetical protein